MRSAEEIRERVRTLLRAELDRRIEGATLRLPQRCRHNHRQPLDSQPRVNDEVNPGYNRHDRRHLPVVAEMGLCMVGADNPAEWPGTICDEPQDAQRCPLFDPLESPGQAAERFLDEVRDPAWLLAHMPEVAHLLWVIEVDDAPPVRLPWWRRWLLRWFPPVIEPRRPSFDPAGLLEGGPRADPRP